MRTGGPLVIAVGLIAAAPILIAVGRAIGFDWTATVDDGVIAVRAFDVFTAHPPLVGQYSLASQYTGEWTYSLGPLNYWLLAPAARLGSMPLIVTTAVVNTACVLGAVALAQRRGGFALMFGVALAIPLMSRSLPPEALYDLLNPWAALFPFTLLLFVAWSVACGDRWLLPLLVFVASFVAQSHLVYLIPTVGVLAIALGGLALSTRRGRQNVGATRWGTVAVIVGLLCWSGPIVDQAIHRPGNIVLDIRSATSDREVVGVTTGMRAVVRTLGVPPWWIRDPRNPLLRLVDIKTTPSTLSIVCALFVLGSVGLTLFFAARQHRLDIAIAAALSLWLSLSMAIVTASLPEGNLLLGLMRYMFSWASPVGMWVWVTLIWSVAVLILPRRATVSRLPVRYALAGTVLVTAASVWTSTSSVAKPEQDFAVIGDAASRVVREIPARQAVRIETTPGFMAGDFLPAITYRLRREGSRVFVPQHYARQLGGRYRGGAADSPWTIRILEGDVPLRPYERVVVQVAGRGAITLSRPAPAG
jgi:hypothetical protein